MRSFAIAALTSTIAAATTSMDACAKQCTEEFHACREKPDANQSLCGTDYGNCLGFAPFDGNHPTITACSKTAMATSTAAVTMDDCARKCTEEFHTCREKPGANQSLCGTDYGNCLGFAPFDGKHPTITACSKTTMAMPTEAVTMDECAKKCTDEFHACREKPGANQSLCGTNYGNCLGFAPFDGSHPVVSACYSTGSAPTNPPAVTGAAGSVEPVLGLVAFGAAALL